MVKLPAGRLGRLARLASLGVRTTASLAVGAKDSAADEGAEVLGTLRGLAAKIGQMGSYVDGLVPEGQQASYERSLKVLRAQAPRSAPGEIRRTVEEELKAPMDQLFASWDDVPIASASIGQVHRAVMPDGQVVAVKVQHASIRQAVESDLANASVLESFAGVLGGRRFDSKALFEVVRKRFREELDYELEADRLVRFARIHAEDPKIRVPALVRERSSASVLTTHYVSGLGFDEACAEPVAARTAWAETLWRYVFKGNLCLGMFNADPHPGNYFFQPDGCIAFVDYGCVQVIPDEKRLQARALHWAAIDRDLPRFDVAVSTILGAKPGRLDDMSRTYTRKCFQPLLAAPYRIERRYAASLVDEMKEMAKEARSIDDREFYTMPPEMLFMNRLQFGLYSVLARLDAEVDYATVERAFIPAPDAPITA